MYLPHAPIFRHARLRLLATLAAVTACAGASQAQRSEPDALQPDPTARITADADGRLRVEPFEVTLHDGSRQKVELASQVGGRGWTGMILWFPGHPAWPRRGLAGDTAPVQPVVRTVQPGSPAQAAGVRPGDVLLSVDGVDARVPNLLRSPRPGRVLALRVRRGTEERGLRVTVGPAPTREQAERALRLAVACVQREASRAPGVDVYSAAADACYEAYLWRP